MQGRQNKKLFPHDFHNPEDWEAASSLYLKQKATDFCIWGGIVEERRGDGVLGSCIQCRAIRSALNVAKKQQRAE